MCGHSTGAVYQAISYDDTVPITGDAPLKAHDKHVKEFQGTGDDPAALAMAAADCVSSSSQAFRVVPCDVMVPFLNTPNASRIIEWSSIR